MNVLIYGNAREKELLVQHMKSQASMAFRLVTYSHAEDYDTYLEMLRKHVYDMVFVMTDNAAGMEGVIAVQNVQPDTPIIWFSNDKNFVAGNHEELMASCDIYQEIYEQQKQGKGGDEKDE